MSKYEIQVTVNGVHGVHQVEARKTLCDFLRHDLGLTGTHAGCEHGSCGACTVLVDSVPVRSCLMLAVQSHGSRILTVEGLTQDGKLHPLQKAFVDHHGLQCGFCTPGFLLTLVYLLGRGKRLGEDELRRELSGNLCRCTGYQKIIEAALWAQTTLATQGEKADG